MRGRIIILGAGVMQGPAIRIARELGLFAAALDGSAAAPCAGMADLFAQVDLSDKEGVEAFARGMQAEPGGLGGIMTAGTDFSASVAWAAERLGLPGIPYETALNASDKGRMRACLKKAGVPSPECATIRAADLAGGGAGIELPAPFPLVVKPVDSMGARGCRMARSMGELLEAAEGALAHSRSGRAIVEAYVEGPEFSIDAIVRGGEIHACGIADRHVFFPPYFVEMGHTMPSAAPPDAQAEVLKAFRAGVRALGIADPGCAGAAKGDVKMSPSGPVIGEIAARLSGGYMSGWTYPYSSGAEPIRAAILLAMGRDPGSLEPQRAWHSAERAFISIPGTVKAVIGAAEARAVPGARDVFVYAAEGKRADFPRNNVSKCGSAVSAAPDREAAVAAAESAARAVLVALDPADPETGRFLRGEGAYSGAFPPPAFALGPELEALLAALPEDEPGSTGLICAEPVPFPEFERSGLRDWAGRGPAESLAAALRIAGLHTAQAAEPEAARPAGEFSAGRAESGGNGAKKADNKSARLGRQFWAALARGGCQGAAYHIGRLLSRQTGED